MPEAIDHRSLEWMPKTVWGPIKWKELHCRALSSLPMDSESQWLQAFLDGLPCHKCREHFEAFIGAHPPDLRSRRHFFEWTVRAHNHVNAARGKPRLTFKQARSAHHEFFEPDQPASDPEAEDPDTIDDVIVRVASSSLYEFASLHCADLSLPATPAAPPVPESGSKPVR
jgi:hypothetical protein